MTVYVVLARNNFHEPVAAFTSEAEALAYVQRQTNLERQRHPHPCTTWHVQAVEVQ
jgi:hypothetical protein